MLSTQLAPDAIAQTAHLLKQSRISQFEQEQIESTIGAIAQQHNWNRDRAAQWLNRQAFSDRAL